MTNFSDYLTPYVTKTEQRNEEKAAFSFFSTKGHLRNAKNYGRIFIARSVEIHLILLLNRIRTEIEKVLWEKIKGKKKF